MIFKRLIGRSLLVLKIMNNCLIGISVNSMVSRILESNRSAIVQPDSFFLEPRIYTTCNQVHGIGVHGYEAIFGFAFDTAFNIEDFPAFGNLHNIQE